MQKQLKQFWSRLTSFRLQQKRSRILFGGCHGVSLAPVSTKIVNPPAVGGIYPNPTESQLCWIDLDKHPQILAQYYNESSRLFSFLKTLGNKIPVFYTEQYHTAVELLFRLKTEQLSDCFVASGEIEILSACWREYPKVGRVFCTDDNYAGAELAKLLHTRQVTTVLTNQFWDHDTVFYLTQRLISVWQFAKEHDEGSLYRYLVSGCSAIFTQQPEVLIALMNRFSRLPTVLRKPLVIGHRGISSNKKYMENTLTTAIESVKLGANVIDVDTRLTKDGRLIAFHGWLIDRILEGSGEVRLYTLAQLQAMKFRYGLNPEEKVLPLEEFFLKMLEAFPEKHLMFTCEIGGDIVESVEKLKEILEKYPVMQDKLMVKCKNGKYGYGELKYRLPYLPVRNYLNDVASPAVYNKETLLHILAELRSRNIPWCAKYRKFHQKLLSQLQLRGTIVIKLMQNTLEKVSADLFCGIGLMITDVNLLNGFYYTLETEKEVILNKGERHEFSVTSVGLQGREEERADQVIWIVKNPSCSLEQNTLIANKSGECIVCVTKEKSFGNRKYQVVSQPIKIIVK